MNDIQALRMNLCSATSSPLPLRARAFTQVSLGSRPQRQLACSVRKPTAKKCIKGPMQSKALCDSQSSRPCSVHIYQDIYCSFVRSNKIHVTWTVRYLHLAIQPTRYFFHRLKFLGGNTYPGIRHEQMKTVFIDS